MTSDSSTKLIAIVGSLRRTSFNRATYVASIELLPENVELTDFPLHEIPLFNGDVEDQGDPAAVASLKDAVRASDGLVIFTPEYNSSFPAVTKNAIDWLSRGGDDAPIKHVGLTAIAMAPGGRAGAGVLAHFDSIGGRLSNHYFGKNLGIGRYGPRFDDQQILIDEEAKGLIRDHLKAFVEFVRETK